MHLVCTLLNGTHKTSEIIIFARITFSMRNSSKMSLFDMKAQVSAERNCSWCFRCLWRILRWSCWPSRTDFATDFVAEFSSCEKQRKKVARLQNEISPLKNLIDTKNCLKNAKKDPKRDLKNDPKRDQNFLSPSRRLTFSHRHFSRSFSLPKICTKESFFTAGLCSGGHANKGKGRILWQILRPCELGQRRTKGETYLGGEESLEDTPFKSTLSLSSRWNI